MGIHDRDYYRDSAGSMFDAWGRQGVTFWLIVINCVVFLAQIVSRDMAAGRFPGESPITEFAIYDYRLVLSGEVWRLFTPMFLHAGLLHLAFNMLVLYWAGSRVEEHYGGREFLAFYLSAGVFASTVRFLVHAAGLVPPVDALGASGAITAVLVLFACHYPHERVLVMFVIPMPVWLMVVIYVGLDALGVLGAGRQGIGYLAHLGGALFGLIYYRWGGRLTHYLPGLPARSRQRSTPRLRVLPHDPDDADDRGEPVRAAVDPAPRAAEAGDEPFEIKVDRVLEKVSRHGQESLTPEEREILFRASEVYKKRRK